MRQSSSLAQCLPFTDDLEHLFSSLSFAHHFSPNLEDSSRLKSLPHTVHQGTTHMPLSISSPPPACPCQTVWNFPQTLSTGPTWPYPDHPTFHSSPLPQRPTPHCPQTPDPSVIHCSTAFFPHSLTTLSHALRFTSCHINCSVSSCWTPTVIT